MVAIAAVIDFRSRRIPNWLTVTGFVVGLGLNVAIGGLGGLRLSLIGAAVAFAVYFFLYLARGMGAGDVKLMAAVGSMVGAANWLGILFCTVILGGVAAIILILATGRVRKTFSNIGYLLKQLWYRRVPYMKREELDVRSGKGIGLPHGTVVFFGVLAFLAAAWTWAPR